VTHRLLERERGERYRSADDVLRDLERRRARGARGARTLLRRWSAVAAVLAVAAGIAWSIDRWWRRPVFDRLIVDGDNSVQALDRNGRVLWGMDRVVPERNFARVRYGAGNPDRLAAFFRWNDVLPSEERQTLHLLDPLTGHVVGQLAIPDHGPVFPGMSNTYGREVYALDIDDDGRDEVVATYVHSPYWPSYSVLCEPRYGTCRAILFASGHHRPYGAVDLDGDGHKELLFAGINNRLGFLTGVAAVRILPWLGQQTEDGYRGGAASTPDATWTYQDERFLYWYALLPSGLAYPSMGALRIDEKRREIDLRFRDKRVISIGFDGFELGSGSELESPERMAARASAYVELRELRRLLGAGEPAAAARRAEAALDQARRAGDLRLVDWSRRMLQSARVREGRFDEADGLASEIVGASESPSDAAWEAARSFHLAGELERAVRWYREALLRDENLETGRFPDEYLEGLILALAERGSWAEVDAELAKWSRSADRLGRPALMLRAWSLWLRGAHPPRRAELTDLDGLQMGESSPDFYRYLDLELAHGEGEAPGELLARIDAELPRTSDTRTLLRSLQAVLLAELGRVGEARERARQAVDDAHRELDLNVYTRAHLALVEERARKLGA